MGQSFARCLLPTFLAIVWLCTQAGCYQVAGHRPQKQLVEMLNDVQENDRIQNQKKDREREVRHLIAVADSTELPLAGVLALVMADEQAKSVDLLLERRADGDPLPVTQRTRVLVEGLKVAKQELRCHIDNLVNRDSVAFKRCDVRVLQVNAEGAKLSVQRNLSQGPLEETNREWDIAITGQGFLQFVDPANGETVYSRAGNLTIDANNQVAQRLNGKSLAIDPPITIPSDSVGVIIQPGGQVLYRVAGHPAAQSAGDIQLALFANPEGLRLDGLGFFHQTDESGVATIGTPGDSHFGVVRQGFLEHSNVDMLQEATEIARVRRKMHMLRRMIKHARAQAAQRQEEQSPAASPAKVPAKVPATVQASVLPEKPASAKLAEEQETPPPPDKTQ